MSKDQGILIEECLAAFKVGRGVELSLIKRSKKVFLIPEAVASIGGKGLIIVYEGGGAYVYSGDEQLNEWVLVSAHFPLQVAKKVAPLVNAIIDHATRAGRSVQVAALPHINEET